MPRQKPAGKKQPAPQPGCAKPGERMFPKDYVRVTKQYGFLGDAEKELEQEPGFFNVPELLRGKTDHGVRKFLVFYFDSDDDYVVVRAAFDNQNPQAKAHPDLNSHALAEMVRNSQ